MRSGRETNLGWQNVVLRGQLRRRLRTYSTCEKGRLGLFDRSLPDLFCDTIPAVHTLLNLDWTARHEGLPVQMLRYKAKLAADFRPTTKANFEWTM